MSAQFQLPMLRLQAPSLLLPSTVVAAATVTVVIVASGPKGPDPSITGDAAVVAGVTAKDQCSLEHWVSRIILIENKRLYTRILRVCAVSLTLTTSRPWNRADIDPTYRYTLPRGRPYSASATT